MVWGERAVEARSWDRALHAAGRELQSWAWGPVPVHLPSGAPAGPGPWAEALVSFKGEKSPTNEAVKKPGSWSSKGGLGHAMKTSEPAHISLLPRQEMWLN